MKILLVTASLLILGIFNSCKKDDVETIYIPTYLRQMLPYSDGQIIRFNSTGGSVLETTVSMRTGFIPKSNCASCDPYVKEEYLDYFLKPGLQSFIQISVDIRPIIFMGIFSPRDNFQIGGGFDFHMQEGISQPVCGIPKQNCLDSVILNGVTYLNVLEINSGASGNDELTKAYYTPEKGIVGFKYGSGYTYNLIN